MKPACVKVVLADAIPATSGWVDASLLVLHATATDRSALDIFSRLSWRCILLRLGDRCPLEGGGKDLQQVRYNFPDGVVTLAGSCGELDPAFSLNVAAGQVAISFWVEEFYQLSNYPFPDYENPGVGDPVPPSENLPTNIVFETLQESQYSNMYPDGELQGVSESIKSVLDEVFLPSLNQSETNKIRQFIKDALKSVGWPANDRNTRAIQVIERYRYCQQQGACLAD